MRYDIEELIDEVRVETENQDVTDTIGIQDKEIIRFLNIAQRQLQSKLVGRAPAEFSKTITLTKDTNFTSGRVFNMPKDAFMRSKITALWTGENNLREQVYVHNITPGEGCCSSSTCCDYRCYQYQKRGYAIVGNKIYLTGSIGCEEKAPKVVYVKTLPDLNKQILEIEPLVDVNMQSGVLQLTATTSFDSQELRTNRRYSLVDEDGIQYATNLKIQGFDSILNQINLSSKNESIQVTSDVNLYLIRGENSSTHTELEDLARDYITRYAIAKVLQRDGSSEYNVHSADLISLLSEIVDAYTNISDDVMGIAQFPED